MSATPAISAGMLHLARAAEGACRIGRPLRNRQARPERLIDQPAIALGSGGAGKNIVGTKSGLARNSFKVNRSRMGAFTLILFWPPLQRPRFSSADFPAGAYSVTARPAPS